jgi:hypothetical protein
MWTIEEKRTAVLIAWALTIGASLGSFVIAG